METIESIISEIKEENPRLANRLADAFSRFVKSRELERSVLIDSYNKTYDNLKRQSRAEKSNLSGEEERLAMFYC